MALTAAIVSAGAGVGGAYMQGQAAKAQANYGEKVAEINARNDEEAAADVVSRGKKEALAIKTNSKKVIGTQRAALAAQGVDVNFGSAADVQDEVASIAEIDMTTVQVNAYREAAGFKSRASESRSSARFRTLAAKNEARNSMITSLGGGAAGITKAYGDETRYQSKMKAGSGG